MESRFPSLLLSDSTKLSLQNSGTGSSPSPVSRLWRPAAQRNLKNQWSKLSSLRQEWVSASSTARSHATSLVNASLSQRFMKDMELGVLRDMPDIQKKACFKLLKQQGLHQVRLISSYKDMVAVVVSMVNASTSLRCFLKGTTSSPLVQFSNSSDNTNDIGDGGGIPVFTFWSISSFEKLVSELVQMFKLELNLKRLLVIEFLSIRNKEEAQVKRPFWSDEIYQGEFNDLSRCNLDCGEACEPLPPKLEGCKSDTPILSDCRPHPDVLQVYLTAWLAEVNIDKQRVEDIFCEVGEEMHFKFGS